MSHEEREIQQLREFRSELADPSAERLAQVRARLTNRPTPVRRTRWSMRGLAVPAFVAAAVLAVAVGAGVVALDGDPSGAAPPAAPPSEMPTDDQQTSSQSEPDPVTAAEHQAAVTLLEQLATSAGTGPAPLIVPAGQLLYVRQSAGQSYTHELWLEVNGGIGLMIRRTDNGQQIVVPDPRNPKDNHATEVEEQRQRLAKDGPSLWQPTPEFLAGLPTDPASLRSLIATTAAQGGGSWSPDYAIVDFLRNFLYNTDPLITPQVRAALYRMLAELPSIGSTGELIDIDGRKVYAIAQSERGQRQELLIDAQTGRIVGSRSSVGSGSGQAFPELWTYAVVAKAGDTP